MLWGIWHLQRAEHPSSKASNLHSPWAWWDCKIWNQHGYTWTQREIKSKADNTVREAKNRFMLSWLHLQTLRGRFRSTSLMMLRKAHTHDRIGWTQVRFQNHSKPWKFMSDSEQSESKSFYAAIIFVWQINYGEYCQDDWEILIACWLTRTTCEMLRA